MSQYGLDLFCTDDFDPMMPDVTGRTVAIQRLVRRLYTPRGSCPDCPNDGIDVRDFLNQPSRPADIIRGIIAGELSKDPACLSANVIVVPNGPLNNQTMTITIDGQLSDGPFSLVLSVSQLTVQLLSSV